MERPKLKNIELVYDEIEDLQKFPESEEFVKYILTQSLEAIEYAIENNKNKIEILNIANLSLIVEVKKSQYATILQKIIDLNLSDRIFNCYDEVLQDGRWKSKIDYQKVDKLLAAKVDDSLSYLKKQLLIVD